MGNPFVLRPPQVDDPVSQYGKLMQLRLLAQEQQMAPLRMQLAQQQVQAGQQENQMRQMQLQDQQAMRQAYVDAEGDPDKFLANVKSSKYGVSFNGIMSATQGMMQMRKAYMDMSKDQLAYQQQVGDTLQGAHDRVMQAQNKFLAYQQERAKLGPLAADLPEQYPGDDQFAQMGFSLKTASAMAQTAREERKVAAQELTAQTSAAGQKLRSQEFAAKLPGGVLSAEEIAKRKLPIELQKAQQEAAIKLPYQIKVAQESGKARAEAFGNLRQYPVIDKQRDNALVMANSSEINANPGRYAPAGAGQKALSQTALIEDIRGNLQQVRANLQNPKMPEFTADQRSQIAIALGGTEPAGAISAAIRGGVLGNLTPEQQDYLVNMAQLTENAMAMRSVLGAGQGSDDLRNAIKATLPGPRTPTKAYGLNQLQKFENVLNRLERGIPNIPLRGQGTAQPNSGNTNRPPLTSFEH